MIRNIVLVGLILSILLVGCQKEVDTGTTAETLPSESDDSIDSDISELESLDEDLDLEELESIDSDLDEINW